MVRQYAAVYRYVFLNGDLREMLLSLIVTAVVLGVTIVFAAAGYLIDISVRRYDRRHAKREA